MYIDNYLKNLKINYQIIFLIQWLHNHNDDLS